MRKTLGTYKKRFYLRNTRTLVEKREGDEEPLSEATAEVQVNGIREYTVSRGKRSRKRYRRGASEIA